MVHTFLSRSSEFTNFQKEPTLVNVGNNMGIVDLKFNKINTNVAMSCLDSTIRIYDIDTSNEFVIVRGHRFDLGSGHGKLEDLVCRK